MHLHCVVPTQRVPHMVHGFTQVGTASIGFKLRPQRIDHQIARQPSMLLQAQQLHQLHGAQAGPAIGRHLGDIDPHREATQ